MEEVQEMVVVVEQVVLDYLIRNYIVRWCFRKKVKCGSGCNWWFWWWWFWYRYRWCRKYSSCKSFTR